MERSWTEEILKPFMQAPRRNVGVYCAAQFRTATSVSHERRASVSMPRMLAGPGAQGMGQGGFGRGRWAGTLREMVAGFKNTELHRLTVCKAVSGPGVSQKQRGGNRVGQPDVQKEMTLELAGVPLNFKHA